ncbi:MAG: hypothetical protein AAF432_12315 [Planctomycetota bacterium]
MCRFSLPAKSAGKPNASFKKEAQFDLWQSFVQWALWNGWTTPEKLDNAKGSQAEFQAFCKKFWNKQFTATTSTTRKRPSTTSKKRSTTTSRKRSTVKGRKTRTSSSKRTTTRKSTTGRKSNLRLAGSSKRSTTRRYSRAA